MQVKIYGRTVPYCLLCEQAKMICIQQKIDYVYEDLTDGLLSKLKGQYNLGRTLPIVIVDGEYIGGHLELKDYINRSVNESMIVESFENISL